MGSLASVILMNLSFEEEVIDKDEELDVVRTRFVKQGLRKAEASSAVEPAVF